MAFCSNCGAKLDGAKEFCTGCGQAIQAAEQPAQAAQPQQQAAPAPQQPTYQPQPPAKKKSNTTIIIMIVVLLIAALAAAAYYTNGFGLFGNSGANDTIASTERPSSATYAPIATAQPSASSNPFEAIQIGSKDALEFMGNFETGMNLFREYSDEYFDVGMFLQANWFDSFGAVSACSLRYYIDLLIESKGGVVPSEENARLSDWDEIASLNMASPFAWAFESFALSAEGRNAEAETAWAMAMANPLMTEDFAETAALFEALSVGELLTAREQAAAHEDTLLDAAGSYRPPFERVAMGWSDVFYLEKGNEALIADGTDYSGALVWFRAALAVDPFDPQNFYYCALMHMEMDEVFEMFYHLEEGLRIAPDDVRLNVLLEVLMKVGEGI